MNGTELIAIGLVLFVMGTLIIMLLKDIDDRKRFRTDHIIESFYIDDKNVMHTYIANGKAHITISNIKNNKKAWEFIEKYNSRIMEGFE